MEIGFLLCVSVRVGLARNTERAISVMVFGGVLALIAGGS